MNKFKQKFKVCLPEYLDIFNVSTNYYVRNRLGEEGLNSLMTIKCEGNLADNTMLEKSLSLWRAKKDRRVFRK